MMCARCVSAVRIVDEPLSRDLLVRVAEREQPQHLTLAVGERVLVRPPRVVGFGGDQPRTELGMHVPPAARDLADRVHHLGVRCFLQDVAARPERERLTDMRGSSCIESTSTLIFGSSYSSFGMSRGRSGPA